MTLEKMAQEMTLEEARTIWLTLLGSEWHTYYDVMTHPQWAEVLHPAYMLLRNHKQMQINNDNETLRIKC